MNNIIELEAIKLVKSEKLFYTKNEIIKEFDIGKTYADKFIKKFKNECERKDSIFPKGSYIETSPVLKWCNRKAFIYFLEHFKEISDENARKYVEPYRVNNVNFQRLYK